MKPNTQIGPAYKKQGASPVSLSQVSRGFGSRDNKRCNPGSDGANEPHENDHVVEKLSATGSNPAFCDSILPRACRAYACGFHAAGCRQIDYLRAKLGITIQNRVALRTRFRECFPQSLHHPGAGWVFRNIEMEDLASTVFDDEETIQEEKASGYRVPAFAPSPTFLLAPG
jgi:hypothetical protein